MEYPSGGAILQTINLLSGRKKAKDWKAALDGRIQVQLADGLRKY